MDKDVAIAKLREMQGKIVKLHEDCNQLIQEIESNGERPTIILDKPIMDTTPEGESCVECNGRGWISLSDRISDMCKNCNGTGKEKGGEMMVCNCRAGGFVHGCVSDETEKAWYCSNCKAYGKNVDACHDTRMRRKGKLIVFKEKNGVRYCGVSCPLDVLAENLQPKQKEGK